MPVDNLFQLTSVLLYNLVGATIDLYRYPQDVQSPDNQDIEPYTNRYCPCAPCRGRSGAGALWHECPQSLPMSRSRRRRAPHEGDLDNLEAPVDKNYNIDALALNLHVFQA